MSYPESRMNAMNSSVGNPSLSSQISSGLSPETSEQKPAPQEQAQNPAVELINQFGSVYQDLKNLAAGHPSADNEFKKVEDALKNWLASASDAITTSGRESANY